MSGRGTVAPQRRLPQAVTWPRLAPPGPAGWLAVLLPVFAWAQLIYPGYFEFHSGFLPIFNLNDRVQHLSELGWMPLIGQPYDVLRGEGTLPYVLAAVPRLAGVPAVTAVKLVFGASILGGALGMYAWTRRRLGPVPGLLATMVYALWPLGLATVYVRGAFAEAALLGLAPWLLWAAECAALPGRRRSALAPLSVLACGVALPLLLAAAIWTQAGLALWLAAGVLIFMLLNTVCFPAQAWRKPAATALSTKHSALSCGQDAERAGGPGVWPGVIGWVGGLALGLTGLLPVLARRGLGNATYVAFTDHFVYPHQLMLADWGLGPSIPGPGDTLTFQLGLVACGLALFGLIAGKRHLYAQPAPASPCGPGCTFLPSNVPYVAAAFVVVLAFLSTTLSAPIWSMLAWVPRSLTYPWQLLLLAGPWLAWLAAFGGGSLLRLLPGSGASARTPAPTSAPAIPAPGPAPRSLGSGIGPGAKPERANIGVVSFIGALLVLLVLSSYGYLNAPTTPQGERPSGATNVPLPDEQPVAIFGENEIALLSARVTGRPGSGAPMTLAVRWQALRPLAHDYTIFFHVLGPDGTLWGQKDTMPQDNTFPTSQWRPGQVVADRYQLILKPDAPASNGYTEAVGLYLLETGQRLSTGTNDKVVVTP